MKRSEWLRRRPATGRPAASGKHSDRNFLRDTNLTGASGQVDSRELPWHAAAATAGQRALIEANIFGHHWAGSQSGFFFLITPRGEVNQNPWAITGDITFRYNKILKTTAGVAVNGTDGQVTKSSNRVLFEHNVFENIGAYVVSGAFNGQFSMIGNAIQNLTIRNTTPHGGSQAETFWVGNNAHG